MGRRDIEALRIGHTSLDESQVQVTDATSNSKDAGTGGALTFKEAYQRTCTLVQAIDTTPLLAAEGIAVIHPPVDIASLGLLL